MATEKRLIDATPIIDECKESSAIEWNKSVYTTWAEAEEDFMQRLLDAPTVDAVEVVHGRWVLKVHEEQCNYRWNVTAECSECQHSKGEIYAGIFSGFPRDLVESMLPMYAKNIKLDNYCPNCGAKMDGDGNG